MEVLHASILFHNLQTIYITCHRQGKDRFGLPSFIITEPMIPVRNRLQNVTLPLLNVASLGEGFHTFSGIVNTITLSVIK